MKPDHISSIAIKLLLFSFGIVGCKKFVQIDPPIDQLVTASVFNNDALATSTVTGIYAQMQSESYNITRSTGLLSDELSNFFSQDINSVNYYTNDMQSTNSDAGPWYTAYSYIFQVNNIIAGLQNSQQIHDAVRKQLRGEALFIRGFWLFYLTNCYGDAPLVTNTDFTVNALIARSPQANVYQQIVSDLEEAKGLLNSNYVAANDTTITDERVRPTQWAAQALLARVYLYLKEYSKAEANAKAVIEHTALYSLVGDLNKVFLSNTTEAIWQLAVPLPTIINTIDGNRFIPIASLETGDLTMSTQLLACFEPGDQRKTSWLGTIAGTNPDTIYYYPYKYKVYESTDVTEYTMVLRLAEQYLIRAEASAQQEHLTDAVNDLNVIRNRAGLSGYSGVINRDSILNSILHERQAELFTEWGHRWFDLIRTGNVNDVMKVVTHLKGGAWSPDKQLFPLPKNELISDHNLTQNIGY